MTGAAWTDLSPRANGQDTQWGDELQIMNLARKELDQKIGSLNLEPLLMVENLGEETTPDDLKCHFKSFGEISDASDAIKIIGNNTAIVKVDRVADAGDIFCMTTQMCC